MNAIFDNILCILLFKIAEFTVDEDFIVKTLILIVLITILIWIYQFINYYYIMRLKSSIEACVLPGNEAKNKFYQKLGDFVSRSMMSRIMTVLNSELARGIETIFEEKEEEKSDELNGNPQPTAGGPLKSILVKDRKLPQRKRSEIQCSMNEDCDGITRSRSNIENCSLTFQPAYVIPVPTYKKIKFNNKLLQNMKR